MNQGSFAPRGLAASLLLRASLHSLTATAANISDIAEAQNLLHGEEKAGIFDAGYIGVEKRAEMIARHPKVECIVAAKRSKIKAMPEGKLKELKQALEKVKAQVRSVVEHPFHVVKNLFHYRKARYRGIAKNRAQLHSLFTLASLYRVKGTLLGATRA